MPGQSASPVQPQSGGFQGSHRFSSKVAITVGSQGLGAMLGYVALLAIGRFYAPGAYGAYIFAVSLIGLLGSLFQLGFNQAHMREIAMGRPVAAALGVFLRIRAVLTLALVAALALALWTWFGLLGRTITDASSLEIILIILVSSVLSGGRRAISDTWVAQGRVYRAELCNFIDSIAYAGGVALVGLGHGAASGQWIPAQPLGHWIADTLALPAQAGVLELGLYVALAHFAGKVAALIPVAYWWLRDDVQVGPWDRALAIEYRSFALPVALTGVLALVLQHTDVLMLGFFWTTREVGWYGAAQKLANVAVLANIAIASLLMPYFASLLKQGEDARAMRVFRQVERFLLVLVMPVAIGLMVWPEESIHILVGDGFLGGATALRWLAAWSIVSTMNLPMRTKHMAAGHVRGLVRGVMITVATNVVLNFLFIPKMLWGLPVLGLEAKGAALATFLSVLVAYTYNRRLVDTAHPVPLLDMAQARMFLAGAAPLVVWLLLKARLAPTAYDRVWELGAIGLLGGAAYVAALFIVKGLERSDLDRIRRMLHPREIVKEVRGRE